MEQHAAPIVTVVEAHHSDERDVDHMDGSTADVQSSTESPTVFSTTLSIDSTVPFPLTVESMQSEDPKDHISSLPPGDKRLHSAAEMSMMEPCDGSAEQSRAAAAHDSEVINQTAATLLPASPVHNGADDLGEGSQSQLEQRRSQPTGRLHTQSGSVEEDAPAAIPMTGNRQRIPDVIPANLVALVMPASMDPPVPTKSLPSMMERMTFHNSSVGSAPHPPRARADVPKTCQTHFRQQGGISRREAGTPAYACQKCSFRTNRMDNLVRHNKADCAFIKDFFSWDANTFTEATQQTPRKRTLSPVEVTNGREGSDRSEQGAKRKGVPRKRLEIVARVPGKRRPAKPRAVSDSIEDGSDLEDEALSPEEDAPHEGWCQHMLCTT